MEADGLLYINERPDIQEPLRDVTLTVERGKLLGICGSVGAGKSSLLSAITGDVSSVFFLGKYLIVKDTHSLDQSGKKLFIYGNYNANLLSKFTVKLRFMCKRNIFLDVI